MPGEIVFRVAAVVVAALPNGTYQAELKNGHRLTAFVTGQARKHKTGINPGDTVKLQLTPYDLSVGRILLETKTI